MKTVLVGGCFDILHYGHISFLKQASALGNSLIVALESDETIKRLKGTNRPIHTQAQRKEMLESLSFVTMVIPLPPLSSDEEYNAFVYKTNPSVIAITEDDNIAEKKRKQAQTVGAEFVVIKKIHTPSTSQLASLLGLE
jgi:FAD synthetase